MDSPAGTLAIPAVTRTPGDVRRFERSVRLPYLVLGAAALAGAVAIAALVDLRLAPSREEDLPLTDFRAIATLVLIPAFVPLLFELLLGLVARLARQGSGSRWGRIERGIEHLAPEPAGELVKHILARLTELGFNGAVERGATGTRVNFDRPRLRALSGYDGLPVRGHAEIEEVSGTSRLEAHLRIDASIPHDTGESVYADELLAYLSGRAGEPPRVRAPAGAVSFAVAYAVLAVALTAGAAARESMRLAWFAGVAASLGVTASALALVIVMIRSGRSVGVPEALLGALADVLVLLTLLGVPAS